MTDQNNTSLNTQLAALLNAHSIENGSNTPDFILAKYLLECLQAYESATITRDNWYGTQTRTGSSHDRKTPNPAFR